MREFFNYRINRYGDETQVVFFSYPMKRGSFDVSSNNITSQQSIKVDKQSLSDVTLFENQIKGYNNQYRSYLRSKQMLYEYSRSNNWDWFVTLTTSPDIMSLRGLDRYDENIVVKNVLKHFANYRNDYPDFKYLFVPELHKDGAVHFHGLISGLPKDQLQRVKGGIYKLNRYEKAFGMSNLTRVKDSKRVAAYITKYITKDLIPKNKNWQPDPEPTDCPWGDAVPDLPEDYERLQKFYKHRYYVSRNCKKSEPEYYDFGGDLGQFIMEHCAGSVVMHCKSVSFGDEYINYVQLKECL